jgi:integrase/recombinase XerD
VVSRYLDHLSVERGLSGHTLQAYRRDLARYQAVMTAGGRATITEVTAGDVAGFLAGLREGDEGHAPLAASSAARAIAAVRGLHAFAAAEGMAGSDVASQVRPPAPPRRLPRAIGVAEVERLILAAGAGDEPGDPRPLRDRALLELLYGTGARISEAVGLDVDDLGIAGRADGPGGPDGPPATLRLSGKGGKQRLVPVGRYAWEALDAYLVRARPTLAAGSRRARPSPAVFLNARGGRLTRRPRGPGRDLPAHAAALLRHPPARRRGGRAGGTGTAGPRLGHDDPGVHPRDCGQTARSVRRSAPPGTRMSAGTVSRLAAGPGRP